MSGPGIAPAPPALGSTVGDLWKAINSLVDGVKAQEHLAEFGRNSDARADIKLTGAPITSDDLARIESCNVLEPEAECGRRGCYDALALHDGEPGGWCTYTDRETDEPCACNGFLEARS